MSAVSSGEIGRGHENINRTRGQQPSLNASIRIAMIDTTRIDAYRAHLLRRRLSPVTVRNYSRTLRVWFAELGDDPTPGDVETWLDQHPGWAPKTASLYLTTVNGYYVWALERGLVSANPVAKIEKPRAAKGVPHPISEPDLERALWEARPQMVAILQLGARAGLRAKEIAAVHTRDITLGDRPQVRIPLGKGDKSRLVPLAPVVLDAIVAVTHVEGFVFPGRPDGHQKPGTISRRVTNHFQALGIDSTCHELRHRFATRLYQTSHDIVLVQRMLGHESIATTQGYAAADLETAGGLVDAL